MNLIVWIIIFFCTLLAVNYSIRIMDFFNPALLFSAPFLIQYTLFLLVYSEKYELHEETLVVYSASILSFMIGVFSCAAMRRYKGKQQALFPIYVNSVTLKIFMIISVVGFILSIFEMIGAGKTGPMGFFANIRIHETLGGGKSFFTKYSVVFLFVVTIVYLHNYLMVKKGAGRGKYRRSILLFLVLILMVSPLFTLARTEVLTYILSITCVVYAFSEKTKGRRVLCFIKKYKKIILLGLVLVEVFIFIGNISGRTSVASIKSEDFFLYRYMAFNLVTFDDWYIGKGSVNGFLSLLGPVPKILGLLGVQLEQEVIIPEWVPYNVTGFYGLEYAGVGLIGMIVFNILIGYLIMRLYICSRERGGYYLLFYSSYIYSIVISFFAYQYANTLYIYIFVLLLLMRIKPQGVLLLQKYE